jgi:hypothetical protein
MKRELSDVMRNFVNEIIELGLAKTRTQAEQLLAESLNRNLVGVEVMDMCRYIANETGS